MHLTRSPRQIAVLAVLLSMAGISFGSSDAQIVPARDKKVTFSRVYTPDYLKNHPLQLVKQTALTFKNVKGVITANWEATIREIKTDESYDLAATGLCRVRRLNKFECSFDAETGTVEFSADRGGGLRVNIPVGQGVKFSRETTAWSHSEILLGAEEENSSLHLYR